jgi:hypothetical protein
MIIPGLFSKLPIPEQLPAEMEHVVAQLKRTKSRRECLECAFGVITKKYFGRKVWTYTRLHRVFTKDVTKLWARSGFLHCHHQNYLLRILLVKSGKFEDADVEQQFVLYRHVSPHQYLRVNVGEKGREAWVDADPWAYHGVNLPLGQHAER